MILKTPQVIKVEKFLFEKKMPIKLVKLDETARSAEEASRALKTQVGSIIKSLDETASIELAIGFVKPRALDVISLSIGKVVPANAAAPRGL